MHEQIETISQAFCAIWPERIISVKQEMLKAGSCRPKKLVEVDVLVTQAPLQQASSIRTTREAVRLRRGCDALTEASDDTRLDDTDTVFCASAEAMRCTASPEV